MKKPILSAILFVCLQAAAQVPQQINYQGVARNMVGGVLANQNISLRLSLHEGTTNGPIVYKETRSLKTNNVGLFVTAIGSPGATNVFGSMASVNWGSGVKFLQVEIDPNGSSNFINVGTSQLLSVPYAMYAGAALPSGAASGDLTGTYPSPQLKNNSVTEDKIRNGAVTGDKLAPGVIPGSLPPSGIAAGDLTGTYPNPLVKTGAITTEKIADNTIVNSKIATGTITADKLAPGVIPNALPMNGDAGGDLMGTYPNPFIKTGGVITSKIADKAVNNSKIADGTITTAKLAPGVIPTSLPPIGLAGGDLTGSYPNPSIADNAITSSKLKDGSITAAKLAPGLLGTGSPIGLAGGDLTGAYPNPLIADNAITSQKLADEAVTETKIADNAISTNKVQDGSITVAKLAPGILLGTGGSGLPSGSAGGDLSGNYPNPNIASGAVTSPKIANGAVNTPKLADGAVNSNKLADLSVGTSKLIDGSVTAAKLAPGVIPTSFPISGNAGGDLSGTYPNPALAKIKGIDISNNIPTSGQVLKFDGSQWVPSADNSGTFALPFSQTINTSVSSLNIVNQTIAAAITGENNSTGTDAVAVVGKISNLNSGLNSAGIKGINNATNGNGVGVWGYHAGLGKGVYGYSEKGIGLHGESKDNSGVSGTSENGAAGYFDIANPDNASDALFVSTSGLGNGINANSAFGHGVFGIANDVGGAGLIGFHNGGGEAVVGVTRSSSAAAVVGNNRGAFAGVKGMNPSANGIGVLASAAGTGTALIAELEGGDAGNTAVFKANGANVARIDNTGKGFFNGGTQVSGADVAEYFAIEGTKAEYEPGDVLIISTSSDRQVEKSNGAYSTLVAGIYATKPGLMLTEENAERNALDKMVPMGVIGVIPTKVCIEGGAIKRGDLIVTSSKTGVAMKGGPDKVKVGQVIGKALQDFNGSGVGKINVLVSIK